MSCRYNSRFFAVYEEYAQDVAALTEGRLELRRAIRNSSNMAKMSRGNHGTTGLRPPILALAKGRSN
jgi:hypothetical protein